jgi:hypothetical protein
VDIHQKIPLNPPFPKGEVIIFVGKYPFNSLSLRERVGVRVLKTQIVTAQSISRQEMDELWTIRD